MFLYAVSCCYVEDVVQLVAYQFNRDAMRIESAYQPVAPEALAAFEAELGAMLPESYRAFLLEHNGGAPEPDTVFISQDEGETDLRMFYGLNDNAYSDLYRMREIFRERMPPELLPVGCDSGGNQFCLALSGPDQGAIYFWDHELETDEGEPPSFDNLTCVADSFGAFLTNLHEFDESQLDEMKVLSAWINPQFLEEQRRKSEDNKGAE